jgi:hypothetical protein
VVQRQAVTNTPPAVATAKPAEASAKKEASGAEPKLDELAERVYSQIRQRLHLERERMRGK